MQCVWWYDDSGLKRDLLGLIDQEIFLARLAILEDSAAEVLFSNGAKKGFVSEEGATVWLEDEEYRHFTSLIQRISENLELKTPTIAVPSGETEQELLPQMHLHSPCWRLIISRYRQEDLSAIAAGLSLAGGR